MAGFAHSVHAPFRGAPIGGTVAPVAGLARRSAGADDSALAQRAAAGDGDAFAELYERHESRAFNLCYRILGSRDDAADATRRPSWVSSGGCRSSPTVTSPSARTSSPRRATPATT